MILVENIHNGETFVIKVCHYLLGSKERNEWVHGKKESLVNCLALLLPLPAKKTTATIDNNCM